MIALPVLGSLALALNWLDMKERQAVTVSFLTLAFARLWHVFNMRDRASGLVRNEVTRNPFIWAALAGCTALLAAAVYVPGLSLVLQTVSPGLSGWLLIFAISLVPLVIGQVIKANACEQRYKRTPGKKAKGGQEEAA